MQGHYLIFTKFGLRAVWKNGLQLFSRGLKYSIPRLSTKDVKERIVSRLTSATPNYPSNVEARLTKIIHNVPVTVAPEHVRCTVSTLAKKLKKEKVLITKSDKGNSVVLLKEDDYDWKMTQCLQYFSFDEYNNGIRRAINSSEYILAKNP